jgi:serine/threonine protein kinase
MSANFEFLSKIGEGSFATVYKVRRKEDSQIYAFKKMKSYKTNDRETQNFLN